MLLYIRWHWGVKGNLSVTLCYVLCYAPLCIGNDLRTKVKRGIVHCMREQGFSESSGGEAQARNAHGTHNMHLLHSLHALSGKNAYSIIALSLSGTDGKLIVVFISVLYYFLKHSPFNYQIIRFVSFCICIILQKFSWMLEKSYYECTLFLN